MMSSRKRPKTGSLLPLPAHIITSSVERGEKRSGEVQLTGPPEERSRCYFGRRDKPDPERSCSSWFRARSLLRYVHSWPNRSIFPYRERQGGRGSGVGG